MTTTDDPPRRQLHPAEPPYDPYEERVPTNLPASAPEAEQALLGALILKPALAPAIALEINPADFWRPQHEQIWDAAQAVAADPARTLDAITLVSELTHRGHITTIGGATYLHTLMAACPIPTNYAHYAKDVRDAARIREVARLGTVFNQVAATRDLTKVNLVLDTAVQALDDTVNRFGPRTSDATTTGLHDLNWILPPSIPPEVPPPTVLHREDGHALFYDGKVNGIFGDPEGGKTWLAQCAIVEALNAGRTAAMIDVDHNGPNHTAARLKLLGAKLEDIANPDRFRYYEPEDGDQLTAAVTDIVARRPHVVLIDSLGEIFPMLGVNTNDGDEITTAMRQVCTRPATAGSCVITIDHLPKSTEARGTGYAIGSIAKKRMIRGSYLRADVRLQPAPGQRGIVSLRIEKDTAGELRKASGGGHAGDLILDSTQPHMTLWSIGREETPKNDDGSFRPTSIMERVSRYIEDNDQCTVTEIRDSIEARPKTVNTAIQNLVQDGFVARFDGARRAKLHHSIAPYREAEDDRVN